MNKMFQNSYFRHVITLFTVYNVGDELDERKGEYYL